MISIPHISYMEELKEPNYPQLPDEPEVDEETAKRNWTKFVEARKALIDKN